MSSDKGEDITGQKASKEDIVEVEDEGEDDSGDEQEDETPAVDAGGEAATALPKAKKKKKSKKSKMKRLLGGQNADASSSANKLTPEMVDPLLEMNPSLKGEVAGMDKAKAVDALRKLDVADLLTGISVSGKNQKDMASYKFWQTQPVPRFDDSQPRTEAPIKNIDPEKVPKTPRALFEGFEWVTLDLTDDQELTEVHELLTGHYVEDAEAMFRLNYSASFLNWALKPPGWRKDWHVGVRASKSRKLVAFISAIPVSLRVRHNILKASEVNFLVVHKKLRERRLAPTMIEEITRRCYVVGVFQAIYTAGAVLPKPFSSCRYFHRPLDWMKLFECKFSDVPVGSTPQRQVTKNHVPSKTTITGLRPMEKKDVIAVRDLLQKYLERFMICPLFTEEEVEHWLIHDPKLSPEQVTFSYVVEDPQSGRITDFSSFYLLESGVLSTKKHSTIRAAYSFYYATETAFEPEEKGLKDRLNALMLDSLVLAKKLNFDVFNALSLLDNPLFLEQQRFGPGDGQLHYYLYNYRTALIPGGVNSKNLPDEKLRGTMICIPKKKKCTALSVFFLNLLDWRLHEEECLDFGWKEIAAVMRHIELISVSVRARGFSQLRDYINWKLKLTLCS